MQVAVRLRAARSAQARLSARGLNLCCAKNRRRDSVRSLRMTGFGGGTDPFRMTNKSNRRSPFDSALRAPLRPGFRLAACIRFAPKAGARCGGLAQDDSCLLLERELDGPAR